LDDSLSLLLLFLSFISAYIGFPATSKFTTGRAAFTFIPVGAANPLDAYAELNRLSEIWTENFV
jgi:hypothetical protein